MAFQEKPAIDFAGHSSPIGTLLVSNLDGVVRFAGFDGGVYGAGWLVEVESEVDGHHVVAGWCHLWADGPPRPMTVRTGDRVRVGTILGPLGYSGWCIPAGAQGAHLHFKLTVDGVRVDPAEYLETDGEAAEGAMTDTERNRISDGLVTLWDRLDRIQRSARGETTESIESLAEEAKQMGVVPIKQAAGL